MPARTCSILGGRTAPQPPCPRASPERSFTCSSPAPVPRAGTTSDPNRGDLPAGNRSARFPICPRASVSLRGENSGGPSWYGAGIPMCALTGTGAFQNRDSHVDLVRRRCGWSARGRPGPVHCGRMGRRGSGPADREPPRHPMIDRGQAKARWVFNGRRRDTSCVRSTRSCRNPPLPDRRLGGGRDREGLGAGSPSGIGVRMTSGRSRPASGEEPVPAGPGRCGGPQVRLPAGRRTDARGPILTPDRSLWAPRPVTVPNPPVCRLRNPPPSGQDIPVVS